MSAGGKNSKFGIFSELAELFVWNGRDPEKMDAEIKRHPSLSEEWNNFKADKQFYPNDLRGFIAKRKSEIAGQSRAVAA
jgi:hypothetical protein